jgi:hypothetical protein
MITLADDLKMPSSSTGWAAISVFLRLGRRPAGGSAPHEELANLLDDSKSGANFEKRWGQLISAREYRDIIRDAWKTDPKALALFDNLAGVDSGSPAYSVALSAIPNSLLFIHDGVARHMRTTWLFRSGSIEVIPDNLWTTICILFLRDHAAGKTAICGNPDCPAPFFLRKRKTQKFCEQGPCVQFAQRKHKLDWWNRVGKKRRARHIGTR